MRFAAILALLCFSAVPAFAEDAALTLFERGDYAGAIAQGEKENTGESLATAARAAISQEVLQPTPCLECLKRAEGLAGRAIAAEPSRGESYIYLASILGHETRLIGMVRARLDNIPSRAKGAIDKAFALDPRNVWVLAALGGWNIEVVHLGGSLLASLVFHADVDVGKARFVDAMAALPGNLMVPYEFALCLAAYDYDGEKARVRMLLSMALADKPNDAYETALQMRAQTLSALLDKGDRRELLAAVARFQGYAN